MKLTKLKPKRTLAWLLTLCMVFGMLPMTAFAEEVEVDSSIITAFEPLDELTANQYWGVGTSIDELILPETLRATVTITSGAAIVVSLAEEDEITLQTEAIAVSEWQSEPEYDPDTMGTYVFTPTLDLQEGYSVADDVELPQITVDIKALMGIMPMAAAASADDLVGGTIRTTYLNLQTQLSSLSNAEEGWYWDCSVTPKTLTLKNAYIVSSNDGIGIGLPPGAKIVLVGDNYVRGSDDEYTSCGIYANGTITIEGDGSLIAIGGTAGASYGIQANNNSLIINGGTVTAIGNGTFVSNGIRVAYDVTISGTNTKVITTGSSATKS